MSPTLIVCQKGTFPERFGEEEPFDGNIRDGRQETPGRAAAEQQEQTIEQNTNADPTPHPIGVGGQQEQATKQTAPESHALDAVDQIMQKFDQRETGRQIFLLLTSMNLLHPFDEIPTKRQKQGAAHQNQGHSNRCAAE